MFCTGEAVRYNMLGTHYRHPVDWTDAGLAVAKTKMDKHYRVLDRLDDVEPADSRGSNEKDFVLEALEDDLNTPMALSALSAIADEERRTSSVARKRNLKAKLTKAGDLLGLLQMDPEEWFKGDIDREPGAARLKISTTAPSVQIMNLGDHVRTKIEERRTAKKHGDFMTADRIRDELLLEYKVILEDKPDGTTDWRRV